MSRRTDHHPSTAATPVAASWCMLAALVALAWLVTSLDTSSLLALALAGANAASAAAVLIAARRERRARAADRPPTRPVRRGRPRRSHPAAPPT